MKTKLGFVVFCLIVVSLFSGCSSQAMEIPVTGNEAGETQKSATLYVAEKTLEFISMKSVAQSQIPTMDKWALTIQAEGDNSAQTKFIYTNGGWEMIIKQSATITDQYLITITNEEEKFSWLGVSNGNGTIIDITPRESRFTKKGR